MLIISKGHLIRHHVVSNPGIDRLTVGSPTGGDPSGEGPEGWVGGDKIAPHVLHRHFKTALAQREMPDQRIRDRHGVDGLVTLGTDGCGTVFGCVFPVHIVLPVHSRPGAAGQ